MSVNKTGSDIRAIGIKKKRFGIKITLFKPFLRKHIRDNAVFNKNRASFHCRESCQYDPIVDAD
jgi:hypothetical protein